MRFLGALFAVWIAWGTPSLSAPLAAGSAGASAPETLVATVQSMDRASGAIQLITGCGHSLRTVRVVLEPGGAIPPPDLRPGTVVRVEIRKEAGRSVVEGIEVRAGEAGR
jgi:hypothetical protein